MNQPELVTIFGGSGFVGTQIVQVLARAGHRIRVAVRRPDLAGHLRTLGGVGQIVLMQANVRDTNSVMAAVRGSSIVINLAAVGVQKGKQRYGAVNVSGARRVAEAAKAAGAHTLVHMSVIGADERSPSFFARSRKAGEQCATCGDIDRGRELLAEALRPLGIAMPQSESATLRSMLWSRAKLSLRGSRFKPRTDQDEVTRHRLLVLGNLTHTFVRTDFVRFADFGARWLKLALDNGDALLGHLGMSGQLLVQPPDSPDERHLRVRLRLSGAAEGRELRFVDQRMFGRLSV